MDSAMMADSAPTPIRAAVLDVDGVLVNPPYRFAKYLEQMHGLTRQHTWPFFTGHFLACIVGRAGLTVDADLPGAAALERNV